MKITKIEPQKNNPDRVNIYADNKFFCGLDLDVLSTLSLKEGVEITPALKSTIDDYNLKSKCFRKALNLLNYRDRTTYELKKKLKEKGFDEAEIDLTVEKIKLLGYINDNSFLDTFISSHKSSVSKGKIAQKLWQLGIPGDLVNEKLTEHFHEGDEYSSCLTAMKNKIRYQACEREKLMRHLLYKGYKYDTIVKVLKDHFPQTK
ncbi:MAG: RecX family transcriptional regulator [Abditibacteriota bacterium]|nr:RecX family transcriptional regulator [Abditibacteriota bacterium]